MSSPLLTQSLAAARDADLERAAAAAARVDLRSGFRPAPVLAVLALAEVDAPGERARAGRLAGLRDRVARVRSRPSREAYSDDGLPGDQRAPDRAHGRARRAARRAA